MAANRRAARRQSGNVATQKQNGPATAPTVPSHGSSPSAKKALNEMDDIIPPLGGASAPMTHQQAFEDLEKLICLTRRRAGVASAFLGLVVEHPTTNGMHKVSANLLETILSTLWEVEDTAKDLEELYTTRCNAIVEARA